MMQREHLAGRALSPSEGQVLDLVCAGQTDLSIAADLGVTPQTVKKHLEKARAKLGAQNRTQAAVVWTRARDMHAPSWSPTPLWGPARPTAEERFWALVDKRPGGCWLWRGPVGDDGFPRCEMAGLERLGSSARRITYALVRRVVLPRSMQLRLTCRSGLCVNPAHTRPRSPMNEREAAVAHTWKKYKKRPLTIEARPVREEEYIATPEGVMRAGPGDYIIRGVMGETYSCRGDIFAQTYDAVDPSDELLEGADET